ncbi:TIGR03862 family flavoprotein [Aureispira anguillae]|uniref:TIGR03862 family flavoprotein n=1 Tax=Aureispira anguillae TaxID=2864201 RepID=A0A916DWQ5_9BACT|nr:TIGR03862 family flavoprotein [Aureispira anguillae]BDS15072.1 TIGR03862 family flavoprotein [Aureispira anguillae]
MRPKKIILIGGGSAALMAAEMLCAMHEVHIYEKGKTIGRKFLVAGNGGFNLTNAATDKALYQQYTNHPILQDALSKFDSVAMRKWLDKLGIPTFVGSSGRVFPEKGIKPIHVLQKIKDKLLKQGVKIHCLHEFIGFDASQQPIFQHQDQKIVVQADAYIFALGGASWSITGSNNKWKPIFDEIKIPTINFQASNCGVEVDWATNFKTTYAGSPLKNIQILIGQKVVKGEALITDYGLEGNAIYPLVPAIRTALRKHQNAIYIDFKPHNSHQSLLNRIKGKRLKTKNYAYEFKLSKAQLALIKQFTTKEVYLAPERFIEAIKHLEVPIQKLRPIEEAISTIGGISLSALEANFSLQQYPNLFVIGEMLDWDAPTGGFLLQGCFSTAATCVEHLNSSI